jgi:DNA ligase (NAD+)
MSASYPENLVELEAWLKDRDREYYEKDAPTVSDAVYDAATSYWERMAGKTWEVLGKPSEQLTRIPHVVPMLSLSKETEIEGVVAWIPDPDEVYVLLPKIDGMAGRLKYDAGQLANAVSRGDGSVGESILHSLKLPLASGHIPDVLPDPPPGDLYPGGEVYLPKELFKLVGGANPRNVGAGLVRRQTPHPHQAHLRFVAYHLVDPTGHAGETYLEQLEWLRCQGFEIPPHATIHGADFQHLTLDALHPDQWLNPGEVLPYEIDGVVITLNNLAKRAALGETGHHPRWACAVKFATEIAVTKLITVEWSATRTGVVVPTAVFEAVNLCGTIVTRATLHNLEHYQKLGVRPGDMVKVRKANDIIPELIGKA